MTSSITTLVWSGFQDNINNKVRNGVYFNKWNFFIQVKCIPFYLWLPGDNWGYELILDFLTHFGSSFYNKINDLYIYLATRNPIVANPFWILVDTNCHFNYEVNSKFGWSLSVIGRTHILPCKTMYQCLWGVYDGHIDLANLIRFSSERFLVRIFSSFVMLFVKGMWCVLNVF